MGNLPNYFPSDGGISRGASCFLNERGFFGVGCPRRMPFVVGTFAYW